MTHSLSRAKRMPQKNTPHPKTSRSNRTPHTPPTRAHKEVTKINRSKQKRMEIPEDRRIQDLEQWLERNGLPMSPPAQEQEDRKHFETCQRRQESLFREMFAKYDQEEFHRRMERQERLDSIPATSVLILQAAEGKEISVPLRRMAAKCETILTMFSSFGFDNTTERCHLVEYQLEAVQEFASIVLEEKEIHDIREDYLVHALEIAHYLQYPSMVDQLSDIMIHSIDTHNCLSICQLADRLNLPKLFERSLGHMMDTMGDVELSLLRDSENDTSQDSFLTNELRERILKIKAAIQTSIHSRSRLYFSSLDEYIAIFSERLQYFRERLSEAKDELAHYYEPGTHAWYDVKAKIRKQEQRVRTLEHAYKQQKKMFLPSKNHSM